MRNVIRVSTMLSVLAISDPLIAVDFLPLQAYQVGGAGIGDMVVGDFNVDGFTDIATLPDRFKGTLNQDGMSFLYGDGSGVFPENGGSNFNAGGTQYVKAVDVNHDGHIDLLVSEHDLGFGPCALAGGPYISVELNNGNGTFTQSACIGPVQKIRQFDVGDFNNDGHVDVVIPSDASPDILTYFGDGLGGFVFGAAFSGGFTANRYVAAGKLNIDGNLDIAYIRSTLYAAFGSGEGTFSGTTSLQTSGVARVKTGDLNGDGIDDLVYSINIIRTKLSSGDGTFRLPSGGVSEALSGQVGAVIDFNGDGLDDIIAMDSINDVVTVSISHPGGGRLPAQIFPAGPEPIGLIVADLNQDGFMDIAVANRNPDGEGNYNDGQISVLLHKPDPPVATNDAASTEVNTPVLIEVLANDAAMTGILNATSVTVLGGPGSGEVSIALATGEITYTPATDYSGVDEFYYQVQDTAGTHSNIGIVTLTVSADIDADGIPDTTDNCPGIANPAQIDTDTDGIGDACDTDDDNDGLTDGYESTIGTDPLSADTDGDGFDDGIEDANGSNPLSIASTPANGDINEDGQVNVADVLLGTRFVLGSITPTAQQLLRGDIAPMVLGIPDPDGKIGTGDLVLIQQIALGLR